MYGGEDSVLYPVLVAISISKNNFAKAVLAFTEILGSDCVKSPCNADALMYYVVSGSNPLILKVSSSQYVSVLKSLILQLLATLG